MLLRLLLSIFAIFQALSTVMFLLSQCGSKKKKIASKKKQKQIKEKAKVPASETRTPAANTTQSNMSQQQKLSQQRSNQSLPPSLLSAQAKSGNHLKPTGTTGAASEGSTRWVTISLLSGTHSTQQADNTAEIEEKKKVTSIIPRTTSRESAEGRSDKATGSTTGATHAEISKGDSGKDSKEEKTEPKKEDKKEKATDDNKEKKETGEEDKKKKEKEVKSGRKEEAAIAGDNGKTNEEDKKKEEGVRSVKKDGTVTAMGGAIPAATRTAYNSSNPDPAPASQNGDPVPGV